MDLDLILKNSKIIDGTGAPWFKGAVGIKDGRIETVDRSASLDHDAAKTVDLDGLALSPGFIDLHSHSGLRMFSDPELEPKTRQGITTEIVGQDGFSMAPMYREGGAEEWEHHVSGLDGRAGIEWTWNSTTEYFDAIDEIGMSPNIGMLVGHGTVRYNVIGMDNRLPDEDELEEMADLVTESLEEGAIGFSTGLDYTPHYNSDTNELQTLASRLKEYGRPFFAHKRNYAGHYTALDEFVDIGAEEEIPLHHSHLQVSGTEIGQADRMIQYLEAARDRGIDMTGDQYQYKAGSTMLSAMLPAWARADGPDGSIDYLQNEDDRARIQAHLEENRRSWEDVVITCVVSEANEQFQGMTVLDIADARDEEPEETVMNLLIEEDLEVEFLSFGKIEPDIEEFLEWERASVASDGLLGGDPNPRTYGTYPQVLGDYVRERNLLTVEEAIRIMTSLPARIVGLQHKGLIRPGMDADLVVFDPKTVGSPATYENPHQFPEGIPHVLVDGEFIVKDSEHTGATPGSAIRM